MIKSSEIASYLYCPVSWWLGKKKGVKITKAMKKGEKHHKTIAENESKAKFLYFGIIIAVIVLLVLIVLRFI